MSSRKRTVVLTDQAKADLKDILNFTAREWGREQRSAYRRLIRDATSTLASSPSLGRARDDLFAGLRSYPARSHMLYYMEAEDRLFIVRILHSRQDPSRESWVQPSAPE